MTVAAIDAPHADQVQPGRLKKLELLPEIPEIPRGRYVDEAFYRLELESVFKRSWLLVGHVSEFGETGDFRQVDISFARVFVVRGKDEVLRAFVNSCRHRGASVLRSEEGCAKNFVCPYHGWTYDLQGTLVGISLPEMFPGFDKSSHSLLELRCETWGGLVYVNFDPAAPALLDWLPAIVKRRFSAQAHGSVEKPLRLFSRMTFDVDCNWKVLHENFREVYHQEFLHRSTLAQVVDTLATTFTAFPNGQGCKSTPFLSAEEKGDYVSGVGSDVLQNTAIPPASEEEANVFEQNFSYFSFPHTNLTFARSGIAMHQAWPMGVNKMRLVVSQYCGDWGPGPRPEILDNMAAGHEAIMLEDLALLPGIQVGIESSSSAGIPLGSQESLLYHLHVEIDRLIGISNVPAHLRLANYEVLTPYIKV